MTKYRLLFIAVAGAAFGSAHAQAFDDFTSTSTTYSGWGQDRYSPPTFAITNSPDSNGNALEIGIDGSTYGGPGNFYNTEGVTKTANISGDWTTSADLWVSNDMVSGSSQYATGLWNFNQENTWYGCLEYRNVAGSAAGFYYWNADTAVWNQASNITLQGNEYYNLTMQQVGTTMNYLVNGTLIGSFANVSDPGQTGLQQVYLEDVNYGSSNDVFYQNVTATPTPAPEPAAMAAMWGSAAPFVIGAIRRRRAARA